MDAQSVLQGKAFRINIASC